MPLNDNGQAVIVDDAVVIRVPLENLPQVVDGAWALGAIHARQVVTNVPVFAIELCRALNHEDEQGTTLVHKMFDRALNDMMESGAEGFEDHPDQDD